MAQLIARRVAISVTLVLAVSLVTFGLQSAAPGDAARTILGDNYSPQAYHELRHDLGLDQTVPKQYWQWLSHAIRGDLGSSPVSGQDVTAEIGNRLPVTLSLVFLGTMAAAAIGVGLGILSAVRGGRLGRVVDGVSLLGWAVPNFWLALMLVTICAVSFRLLPATGYVPLRESPSGWAQSLVLPIATLALPGAAAVAKHTRHAMAEELTRPYVGTLRANGASEASVVFRHALRNAAIPVVTLVGLTFISLFTGTVFVESVFAMPGLGGLAVDATKQRDIPMVQGVVFVFTLVVVAVNLVVDTAYGWLNPKVRTG